MLTKEWKYQRRHLRAPYKGEILYADQGFVFKAPSLNISEGGLLLFQVPYFPEDGKAAPVMLSIPQHPSFKNYSLEKLKSFTGELFPKKIIRVHAKVVRKEGAGSDIDQLFETKIGCQFTEITPQDQKTIKDYVDVFFGNIIHLQVLLDNVNADDEGLEKVRVLGQILGYNPEMKLAQFRQEVSRDYQGLQWL